MSVKIYRLAVPALCASVGLSLLSWSNDVRSQELPSHDRVRVLATPRPVDDAELTDQNGRPFRLSELRGRVALILFGFTNCQDVCPLAMESFRQLNATGQIGLDDLAYVMISVDGERDSPVVMKSFLSNFSNDFIGLTGDPEDVRSIAEQFSASFFKGNVDHDGHYNVTHSPQVFAVDRNGRVRAEFYSASLEALEGIVTALSDEGG